MIARKSALIIATNILNGILGFVMLFFITRFIGPSDYGIVTFALSFVTLFTIFGNFGYDSAHIKRVSEGKNLGKCIGTYFTIRFFLMCLMTFVVIIAIFLWKNFIGFESSIQETVLYILLGYCVLSIISNSMISTFKARKEIAKAEIPLFLEVFGRAIATLYVVYMGYGAIPLAFTYIVGWGTCLIFTIFLFYKYPIKKPDKSYFRDYTKFAFPLTFMLICSIIINNIDRIFIYIFCNEETVGYYSGSYRLSAFINMFSISIGILLFPTFSNLHSNNNISGIRKLIYRSERYISMVVFPMVFIIVLLSESVVFILLAGWDPAIPIMQILPFFVLFAALERPYQSQFLGMDKPKIARNRLIIMVLLDVVLNFILIPDMKIFNVKLPGLGATGAAIALVISYAVGLIYSRIMAWKLTEIKVNPRIFIHAFAATIMGVILYILLYEFKLSELILRWYHLLFFSLLGLAIYLIILIIFREFTKEDFHLFLDTINIKKMYKYIHKEVRNKEEK